MSSMQRNMESNRYWNEYFSKRLVDSWGKPNTHAGKPMVCSQKCGKQFDAFAEQFK